MMSHPKVRQNKYIYIIGLLVVIILLSTFILVAYQQTSKLNMKLEKEEIQNNLVAKKEYINKYFDVIIRNNKLYANRIGQNEELISEETISIINEISSPEIIDCFLITSENIYYSDYSTNEYMNSILNGHPFTSLFDEAEDVYISDIIQIDTTDCFINLIPITKNNIIIGALGVVNKASFFRTIIQSSSYNTLGYCNLVKKDQSYIIKSEKEVLRNHNKFSHILLIGEKGLEDNYSYNGELYIILYIELDISDWYLVLVVPQKEVYNFQNETPKIMIILGIELFLITSCFFIVLIIDINSRNKLNKENNMLMKTTMVYGNQFCAVFDYEKETYRILNYGTLHTTLNQHSIVSKELWDGCVYRDDLSIYLNMFEKVKKGLDSPEEVIRVRHLEEKEYRHFNVAIFPVSDKKGRVKKALCIATDIEEDYQDKIKLHEMIEYDNFTGLLNRLFFEKKVKERLKKFDKKDRAILILIDIDGFKNINDILRHSFGDEVILYTASVLKDIFRKTDLISRLGGDEFLVWLEYTGNVHNIEERLNKLQEELAKKLLPGTKNRYLSASAGVVIVRKGDTYEALYDTVDDAMYKSKRSGKGLYTIVGYEVVNAKDKQVYNMSQTIKEQYILDQVIKNVSVPYYAIYYFDVASNNYYCYKENGEITLEIIQSGNTTDFIKDYLISYVHPDDVDKITKFTNFEHFKEYAKRNDDGTYSLTLQYRRFFEDHYIEIEALAICNEKTQVLPEIITIFFKKVKG